MEKEKSIKELAAEITDKAAEVEQAERQWSEARREECAASNTVQRLRQERDRLLIEFNRRLKPPREGKLEGVAVE